MKAFYLCHLVLISTLAASLGAQPAFSDEKKAEVELKGGAYSGYKGDGLSAGVDFKAKPILVVPQMQQDGDATPNIGMISFTPRVRGSVDLDTDAKQVGRAAVDVTLGSLVGARPSKNFRVSLAELGYSGSYNRALGIREAGIRGSLMGVNFENDIACVNVRYLGAVFASMNTTILDRKDKGDGMVQHPFAASVCGKVKVGEKGDTLRLTGRFDAASINNKSESYANYYDGSISLAYEKIKGSSWAVEATGSATFADDHLGLAADSRLLVGASKAY